MSVDFYQINGNSTAALDREIKRKGPRISGGRHAVAVARIKMMPTIKYQPSSTGCKISSAKVAVDAKVTLPQWSGRKNATGELGQAWDNIDRYTRLHEAMHVAIAFRYARRIEEELLALKARRTCSEMRNQSKVVVDRFLEEHDAQQKKFDADEQRRFAELAKERNDKTPG